jgi:hypothetical protein
VKSSRIPRLGDDPSGATVAAEVLSLSLTEEKARLDSRLLKLKQRRKRVENEFAA